MALLKASVTAKSLEVQNISIPLKPNSIVVVTGPNNSGKSTFLGEIVRYFRHYGRESFAPKIISDLEKEYSGSSDDLIVYLKDLDIFDEAKSEFNFSYGKTYKQETLTKAWENGTLPGPVEEHFLDDLDPRKRLGERPNYGRREKTPISALWDNEEEEIRISKIFRKAFGVDLILSRSHESGDFKIGDRKKLPAHKKRLTKEFRKLISSFERVDAQGDGLRSFASIALDLLTRQKSAIVIDEPELFLHPPQIRQLARLIIEETPQNSQIYMATHSDDFIKGLLDSSHERVIVVRLSRPKKGPKISILDPDDIATLWQDPLFRTSNILSGLFHDVAILVEGESDARFLSSAIHLLHRDEHLPDLEFFSTNGKSKMHLIAAALRKVNVPVAAAVDLDILARPAELDRLYRAMGGSNDAVLKDAKSIESFIRKDKQQLSGRQFKSEIDQALAQVLPEKPVPEAVSFAIKMLGKNASPWARLKTNGRNGLTDALAVQALDRIVAACADVGILINIEGELEGLCRTIPRSSKSEWLSEVLKRDIVSDPELAQARAYVNRLTDTCRGIVDNS